MSPLAVRRCIYGILLLSLSAAVWGELRYSGAPTSRVKTVFDTIEKLPRGSRVVLSLDYDPSGQGELAPMAAAFVRHLGERGHRILFLTLWDAGAPMLKNNVAILRREYPDRVEGRDFVDLGYKAGRQVVITNAMADLSKDFPTDARGISLRSMELTRNLRNFSEVDLLISVGAGSPGIQEWVQYAPKSRKYVMLAGTPGVQAPSLFPYVPQQLREMIVAIKGAAEYEQVLNEKYPHLKDRRNSTEGQRRMGPQIVAHLLIVGLIVLGNALSLVTRRS